MGPGRILIATDFSPAAEKATEFAVMIAKKGKYELQLLHIIPEIPGTESFKQLTQVHPYFSEVANRLQKEAHRLTEQERVVSGFLMKEGNIFEHIGSAAQETNSKFVVMATHGLQGIQYLTGSHAGKVIESSPVPVCIVQVESAIRPIEHFVIAPDFTRPVRPLLHWAIEMSQVCGAKVEVALAEDQQRLDSMKVDLSFGEFQSRLEVMDIPFQIHSLAGSGKVFQKNLISLAGSVTSPLIIAELGRKGGKAAFTADQQTLISNPYHIPVFILNA